MNLPRAEKWAPPRYQDLRATAVSLLSSQDGGALVRVIAGEVAGHPGPGQTYTPMTMLHVTLAPGWTVRGGRTSNALAYVLAGAGSAGVEAISVSMGQLTVFGPGDAIRLHASRGQESRSPEFEVLVLGGRPIREPVAWYGPFVMNTKAELLEAFEDYHAGKLGTIPVAHHTPEHIVESPTPEPPEPPGVGQADRG